MDALRMVIDRWTSSPAETVQNLPSGIESPELSALTS
jgi:hypothetical protein